MINQYKVDKVTHVWCEEDDRWIYIEYNNQSKIVGLGFMQGDEYDYFKDSWCHNDQGLMQFYNFMIHKFQNEKKMCTTLEFINKVMWAYHFAIVAAEDYGEIS